MPPPLGDLNPFYGWQDDGSSGGDGGFQGGVDGPGLVEDDPKDGTTDTPDGGTPGLPDCIDGPGYWMNHPDAWPVEELFLGGRGYSVKDLVAFLRLPTEGDVSVHLGTHLVATRLNLASGAETGALVDALDAADAWLEDYADEDGRLPYGVASGDEGAEEGMELAEVFADFNAGLLPVLCVEPLTP